jgi:hypothetical protein
MAPRTESELPGWAKLIRPKPKKSHRNRMTKRAKWTREKPGLHEETIHYILSSYDDAMDSSAPRNPCSESRTCIDLTQQFSCRLSCVVVLLAARLLLLAIVPGERRHRSSSSSSSSSQRAVSRSTASSLHNNTYNNETV